jgi:hypothetical protein
MSPCCLAAAAAAAAATALIVVGLTAFVLATDGFGLGVLASTVLAVALQRAGWIGPCPRLLDGFSVLLALRAAWLLATTRRPLVIAAWRAVLPGASWVVQHLTPLGWLSLALSHRRLRAVRAEGAPAAACVAVHLCGAIEPVLRESPRLTWPDGFGYDE